MTGRLLASDAEADAVEIEAALEAEIDRLRRRVTDLEDTLRNVGVALPMAGADLEVARAVLEEIEKAIAGDSDTSQVDEMQP